MGGMENWILQRKDNPASSNPLNFGPGVDNRDVFFAEFATNLRGFNLNRLSGTNYILANIELRVPLIKYLYRGPITSNFLRNFQIIGFSDIGTAWTGKGPFSQENSLNTEIVGGGSEPFRATVTNFRNPYLMGYGVGVRTMLFGFYVKFDYAWGIDNGVTDKAIPYVTLGYDF
jgi:outer membrane protein assembly factor BamA